MNIIYEPSLSKLTTLRLGGKAIALITIDDINHVEALPQTIKKLGSNIFILGAGSNLLANDGNLDLILLKSNFKSQPSFIYKENKDIHITVGSGISLPRLLGFCAKHGLSGLEGLSGIPGTVGGAIAMNAGSYGNETCKNLSSITIYTPEFGIMKLSDKDFSYTYRKFSLCNTLKINTWYLIIEATFKLTQISINGIKERMLHDFLKKKSTQPIKALSAGCVFKNPKDYEPAGKLLDVFGFKGKSKGDMSFSSMHANFLINNGKGSSMEAFELINEAKECIRKECGLILELEVKTLLK